MIHINSRDGHEMLTQEEFNERHPGLAAALNAPRPFAEEGEVLKRMRQAADMSVRELAKAIGMRASEISDLEHGRTEPTLLHQDAYAMATRPAKGED